MFTSTTLLFCAIIAPALSAPDGYFTEKAPSLHQYITIGQIRAKRQVWEPTTADRGPSNIEINNPEKPNEQPQNNKDEQNNVSYIYYDSMSQNYNRPPPPRHYPPRFPQRYPPQRPPPHWGEYYDQYERPHDGRYPRRPGPPNPYGNEHRPPPPPHPDFHYRHRPPPPHRDERSWLPPHHRRPPPPRDHWPPPPPPHHGPPHFGHGPPRPPPYDHGPPYHDRGPPHHNRGPPPPPRDHGPPHRDQGRPPAPPYARGPPNHRPPSPPPNGNQPARHGQGFPPGDHRHQGQDQISSNDNIPSQPQISYPNTFSTNEDKVPSNLNNKESVLQNNKQDYTQLESPNDDKTADIIQNLKLVFSDDFRNTFLNNRQTSQNESSNNDNPTTVNIVEPQYKKRGGVPLSSLEANISDSINTTPPPVPHIFQVVPVTPES